MADRHTRGISKVVGELSSSAKAEFCKRAHTESIELAGAAIQKLRVGNWDSGWKLVLEGKAIGDVMAESCANIRFKI